MSGLKRYCLASLALTMMAALSACTTYEAYRKCGFGGCPGDAAITAEVRARFGRHPVLQPPNILSVQTLDHVVYLTGLVDTDLERQIAESVALEAPGVKRVVNSIGISGNR
jgi:osmotically-inducible protein OsmY